MKTELCDLLNIEYPIIQGAMAHITDGKFAAAVSNAGGTPRAEQRSLSFQRGGAGH